MKKCPFCDNEIEETVILCHHCGKSLWSHVEEKRLIGLKVISAIDVIMALCIFEGVVSRITSVVVEKGPLVDQMPFIIFEIMFGVALVILAFFPKKLNAKWRKGNIVASSFAIYYSLGLLWGYSPFPFAAFLYIGLFIFFFWSIIYLNRPKVKEHFK